MLEIISYRDITHISPDKAAGDSVFPKQVSPNLYWNDESLDSLGIASAFHEWDIISFFAFGGGNLCVPYCLLLINVSVPITHSFWIFAFYAWMVWDLQPHFTLSSCFGV